MRPLLILCIASILTVQASAQDIAPRDAGIPSNWKDFATSSYVTVERTRARPEAPASTSQIKTVLRQSDHSAFTRYRGNDGFKKAEDGGAGEGVDPEKLGFKKSGTREEKITLAGKEYESTVTTLRMDDRRGKKELVIWEVKDLDLHTRTMGMPGPDLLLNSHVVKAQLTLGGTASQNQTQTVVKLNEKLTIGENEISCLVERLEGDMEQSGMKMKMAGEYWTSEDVPGRDVKRIMKGTVSKESKMWPGKEISENAIVIATSRRLRNLVDSAGIFSRVVASTP